MPLPDCEDLLRCESAHARNVINYVIAIIVFELCLCLANALQCDRHDGPVIKRSLQFSKLFHLQFLKLSHRSQTEFRGPWVSNAAEQKYKCDLVHCSSWRLYLTRVSDTSEGDEGFLGTDPFNA